MCACVCGAFDLLHKALLNTVPGGWNWSPDTWGNWQLPSNPLTPNPPPSTPSSQTFAAHIQTHYLLRGATGRWVGGDAAKGLLHVLSV